jgi:hypothetical protein
VTGADAMSQQALLVFDFVTKQVAGKHSLYNIEIITIYGGLHKPKLDFLKRGFTLPDEPGQQSSYETLFLAYATEHINIAVRLTKENDFFRRV